MKAAAAALLVLATACGDGRKAVTVAINAGVEGAALEVAAREWGALRSIPVETVVLPYANLFEKELLDLVSGTGAYDVIMIDDPWFPQLAATGSLANLEALLGRRGLGAPDSDFAPSCLRVCRHPYETGPYYALPYVGNSQLFFYRADLFRKHGLEPPHTWQAVLEAARRIGAAEGMYGYVMRAASGNAVVTDFMPLMWAFGGEMLTPGGEPAVASPEVLEALRFMLELGRYSPPGYAGFNADELGVHLLHSTAVMSIKWPAWIPAMDDPARSKVVGRIEFGRMPSARKAGAPALGAWLLAIPSASRNQELALEFLLWVTAPGPMKQAALRGNPPTRRSVFADPELRRRFRGFPAQQISIETARPRPRTPHWNELENAFGIYLSQANAGGVTAEEALRLADREMRVILGRKQ